MIGGNKLFSWLRDALEMSVEGSAESWEKSYGSLKGIIGIFEHELPTNDVSYAVI